MWKINCVLLFVLCCSSSIAEEITPIGLAKSHFNQGVSHVNRVEKQCEESENVLDKNDLKGITADKVQLKEAVIYYYLKAKSAYADEAVKNYLLASAVLSSLDTENSDLYSESDKLIPGTNTQLIKAQVVYEALPDSLKSKLSNLEILHSPFNLLKSIELLGLE